jgi:hypothetical protein
MKQEYHIMFQEVKDTIDKEAVYRCMTSCYTLHQTDKPRREDIGKTTDGSFLQPAKSIAALGGSIIQGVMVII